uniref:Uncharacterized protein n=1 Tax=Trachysalambria curvirostris majanivirus TaxID=2984281 RepID=A0A9C7BIN1_9VIRU|nr:MAG: hypothetical protein [Trachysalambria curvirostris majanivirus]
MSYVWLIIGYFIISYIFLRCGYSWKNKLLNLRDKSNINILEKLGLYSIQSINNLPNDDKLTLTNKIIPHLSITSLSYIILKDKDII